MPKKQHNELVAGSFVIAAILAAVGVLIWLGVTDVFKPTRQWVSFYVPESAGSTHLELGNAVQIGGKVVGKVARIDFDPSNGWTYYVAEIEDKQVSIHSDGKATFEVAIIGPTIINVIDRGTASASPPDHKHPILLEPGGGITGSLAYVANMLHDEMDKTRPDSVFHKLDAIMTGLVGTAADVQVIAKNIKDQTDVKQAGSVLAKIDEAVQNVKVLTASIRSQVDPAVADSLMAKVRHSADNIDAATGDFHEITANAKPKIAQTVEAISQAAAEIHQYSQKDAAELFAQLRQMSTQLVKASGDLAVVTDQAKNIVLLNRDNIDQLLSNMTLVSDNFKATAEDVRRNPWKLFHKPDEKELKQETVEDATRAFASGATQLNEAIAKLNAITKACPKGISPDDPEIKKVRQQIQDAFENFNKVEQALWNEISKK
jgi:ABC-type transporter Mla subunit MlaD